MSELKLQQCRLDGRYDILECLGRGSYSEVYIARDTAAAGSAPETVVIKALNAFLQGAPDTELERTLVENFRNEAVALDRARHPNIINRLGHGTALDLAGTVFHYLVLEYLPGGDMASLCRRQPLPLDRAIFYLEQVCAGLTHAHSRGVIHRDVKPQNLLLTADRRIVKIADFGVAKIEPTEGGMTRVGTEVYAAPEHNPLAQTGALDIQALRVAPSLSPAADVYSLAKTTYMLLTGEAPRQFSHHSIKDLPPLISHEPWSPFVLRVLNRATQTDAAKRYQTVREFWDELHDAVMPATQLLKPRSGDQPPHPLPGKSNGTEQAAPLPATRPAPFEPPSRLAASTTAQRVGERPRIVVHVGNPSPAMQHTARNSKQPPTQAQTEIATYGTAPETPSSRFSSTHRVRRWFITGLIAVLVLSTFAMVLLRWHNYVRGLRRGGATATTSVASPVGRTYLTTTDVKLRNGPAASTAEIGRAEVGSQVRVIATKNAWWEVKVLKHGRAKENPTSADQGWLNSTFLKPE
ncbi:MAG: protein kinase [Pyrinomonadaceae bacterium]|nr:protein kinase [Pyrinomonadaceae bacterium]